ncbi:nucleotidyltransferase domain-containing protein [Longibacter salinarum]|nr:nucleotidyltransferase family protein [Longibacter salinarum]
MTSDIEREVQDIVSSSLDWMWLARFARRHGVAALLVHHLHRLELGGHIPDQVRDMLWSYGKAVLTHNVQAMGELIRVIEAFDAEGIDAMPIKGPVLANRYYGNLAFRRFVDLDIVVREERVHDALDVLDRMGYELGYERTPDELESAIRGQLGIEMVERERRMVVEVHWALLNRTYNIPLDPPSVWGRVRHLALGDKTVAALSTEDLLLYLCAHGTKHHWAGLKWACDVAEVLRSADIDWDALNRLAQEHHCTRILHLGLALAYRWLDAPVPERVIEAVRDDSGINRLIRQIEDGWLWTDQPLEPEASPRKVAFTLGTRTRVRDNARFFWHNVGLMVGPNKKDRAVVDLPGWLAWAYVVIRPFRVITDWLEADSGEETTIRNEYVDKPIDRRPAAPSSENEQSRGSSSTILVEEAAS